MSNEYEKLRMRQNPMLQPRAQAGGRSMPAWFAATLVNPSQSRVVGPSPPPPPVPAEPPPEESDYEEIDHLPKSSMKKTGSRRACSLCGNPNPAVSCEMCDNQIFCGSCNDMYHRHPKRQHHSRKILEPLDNRPPLPPKTPVPHEMGGPPQAQLPPLPPSHPAQPNVPQPPPRRKGRFGMRSATSSPTTGRKSFFDPVGTLKRFMGGMAQRPLPSPPKQSPPPLPPKSDFVRSMTPTFRGQMIGDRRLASPQPGAYPQDMMSNQRGGIPVTVLEMQNARTHSISVANLSGHTSSRDSGYPDWEEDEEEFFARNRAHSVSGGALGRFPSTSQDASHFATMHRPGRNQRQQQPFAQSSSTQQLNHDAPERPPPPLPPRQFPSQTQLSMQSSQSAWDLDRMAAVQQQQQFGMSPWNYPMPGYPFDFQQAMMMGYPGGGTMHRTPSTQSMGPTMNPSSAPNQQAFFGGWGPMGFGPPMTQMEMEMMAANQRRGSEQFMNMLPQQPPLSSQRAVPLSNPVTPQGSFRKTKPGRHMSVEPELTRRLDRVDLSQNRRSGTPSSFVRVPPSTAAPIPSGHAPPPQQLPSPSKSKPPAKPPSEQSPDDSYFSAERQQLTESGSSESSAELTENPEGPWECEHCTFINPKSTKVCTICCKTPSDGYKVCKGKVGSSSGSRAKTRKGDAAISATEPSSRRRDSSGLKGRSRSSSAAPSNSSGVSTQSSEEVPVLKSKLSISREKQQAKINLVSHVERERVKTPGKSAMKAGTTGTLKAGTVPPGLAAKVAAAASGTKSKKVKSTKKQIAVQQEDSDDEDEEEIIAVANDDDEQQAGSEEKEEDGEEQEEDEEDEEEDEDEEVDEYLEKSEDDADDEETGVMDVKFTAGSSSTQGKFVKSIPQKGIKAKAEAVTSIAPVKKSVGKVRRTVATKKLVDSNEDVYGSVPIQTLAISPKIEIRRSSKSKVSTGVGSSPPKHSELSTMASSPTKEVHHEEPIYKSTSSKQNLETQNSKISKDVTSDTKEETVSSSLSSTKTSSEETQKPKSPPEGKVSKIKKDEGTSTETSSSLPSSTRQRKEKVSTGIQTGSKSTSSSSPGESETGSSSPFQARKEMEGITSKSKSTSDVGVGGRKSSVGTSPPPQSISTQTYEDAPAGSEAASLTTTTKSSSKTSLRSDDYYEPPRPIEMSEKALRYARKARNKEQHHQKLKRSLSTQLTYPAEQWLEGGEGRHLYRSSSRQSLMSDTRSLPLSGPPSRENSPPPPMRGSGGGSSRWYEDFRRYPPPTWDRFPVSGDFFASIDDLMSRRRRESMRSQEFELTRMLKDADEFNFSPEDIQVGIRMCGDRNPIRWLQENWSSMIETVQALATKYGREKGIENNDVGTISTEEAKESLRANRGNVWAAVTECVDQRRKKFHELQSRGTFLREDVLTALTAHHGNLEAAYVELSKAQLKPFLMRIWGPSSGAENESAAPSSSNAVVTSSSETSKASRQQPAEVVLDQRSASLPGPVSPVVPKERKTSAEATTLAGDTIESPKLEKLVSNAEKVTQEIERAIQELKSSGVIIGNKETREKNDDDQTTSSNDNQSQSEKIVVVENKGDDQFDSQNSVSNAISAQQELLPTKEETVAENSVILQRQKSESESEPSSTVVQHVKSDGEEESFVDAVSSESASNTNSPPPTQVEVVTKTARGNEINEDDQELLLEDEYDDEDVLEIEIDDSEANISEFIQNYEILPAQGTPISEEDENEGDEQENGEDAEEEEQADNGKGSDQAAVTNTEAISKGQIEQLLTTLTSTFTEMEQFAYKIKENIASEIQQQLAAAKVKASTTSHDHSEDGSYEPIALAPGIEENVNKKVAKYQKLAAKKKQKVGRHKSPETRAFQFGMIKEPSVSPLPSTSLSQLAGDESRADAKASEKTGIDHEQQQQEEDSPNNKPEKQEQAEDEKVEETTTRYADYEEVEIGQEDEKDGGEDNVDDRDGSEQLAGGSEEEEEEEGEFVEEDVNESSIVEESDDEEIMLEAEEGPEEELELNHDAEIQEGEEGEENDDGNENEQVYENMEISNAARITPSDTDKVIVTGSGVVVAKAIRNSSNTNGGNNNGDIVIMAEEITTNENENNATKNDIIREKSVEVEETPADRLIKEGKAETKEHAELALQLIEMSFSEDDALHAAKECGSLCGALSFLQQECDLCTGKFSAREMVSMLRCTHLCCRTCARDYFTVQVRDKTILDATCPFCAEPSTLADDAELATEYFNHLDILLKNLLDGKHHEMFQRKLRDWTLAKTPNFKWCSKCSSGFITEPLQTRLVCPDCKAVTCAVCMEPWDKVNHDHRDNNASGSVKLCDTTPKSIIEYLNANCIECPRCHFRFSLARGGCMHLTCTQCHHEFCSGCSAPFRMGEKCEAKFPICDKLGLHAHHPRNCLFYLRDKEPDVLAKLLEENAIPYFKENSGEDQLPASAEGDGNETVRVKQRVCHVPIQRETSDGFADDICGKEAPEGYATVCKTHYIEYLGLLIWQNHLDPITILTNDDLEVIVRRAYKRHPGRPNWLSDEGFRKRLLKVINDEIPL